MNTIDWGLVLEYGNTYTVIVVTGNTSAPIENVLYHGTEKEALIFVDVDKNKYYLQNSCIAFVMRKHGE